MLGHKERDQLELFITGSLRQLIPDEHVQARVDRVLDRETARAEKSVGHRATEHENVHSSDQVVQQVELGRYLWRRQQWPQRLVQHSVQPAAAGNNRARVSVEACARCAAEKASLT